MKAYRVPEYDPSAIHSLRDIEKKARAFVATTSFWQQRVASRPEFEELAFALLRAPGAAQTPEDPTPHKEKEASSHGS